MVKSDQKNNQIYEVNDLHLASLFIVKLPKRDMKPIKVLSWLNIIANILQFYPPPSPLPMPLRSRGFPEGTIAWGLYTSAYLFGIVRGCGGGGWVVVGNFKIYGLFIKKRMKTTHNFFKRMGGGYLPAPTIPRWVTTLCYKPVSTSARLLPGNKSEHYLSFIITIYIRRPESGSGK
jgi:hypothetical protein